jgi:plastocyanin
MKSRLTLTLGLLALAVTLAACGSSMNSPASPSPTPNPTPNPNPGTGANVTITIASDSGAQSFSPNPSTLTAGQTVAWYNADSVVHDVTADDGSFTTGAIAPGATSGPIAMEAAGTVTYHCSIHPSMVGSMSVIAPY